MARIICTIDHITPPISGPTGTVNFTEDRGQWISDEVTDEVAAEWAAIPGFMLPKPKLEVPPRRGPGRPPKAKPAEGQADATDEGEAGDESLDEPEQQPSEPGAEAAPSAEKEPDQ